MGKSKYTPEYFIAKFERIPDAKWTTGAFKTPSGACCALGHCGVSDFTEFTGEGNELDTLFRGAFGRGVVLFNDASYDKNAQDLGDTPKERVINALTLIATGLAEEAV